MAARAWGKLLLSKICCFTNQDDTATPGRGNNLRIRKQVRLYDVTNWTMITSGLRALEQVML